LQVNVFLNILSHSGQDRFFQGLFGAAMIATLLVLTLMLAVELWWLAEA
jgi:hypothetical protein